MDFTTTLAVPVSITIDATAYSIPRFLMPALKLWAAERIKQQKDVAMEELKTPDDKARFLYYFAEPLFDIAGLLQFATTPEGAEYVVDAQMKLAGVPDEVREKVKATAPPHMIRALAQRLTQSDEVLRALGVDVEAERADPLPPPATASAGLPETGTVTTPEPAPSTASST